MQPEMKSTVDYAVMARIPLNNLARLENDEESIAKRKPLTREWWRDYGAALQAQRDLMPGNDGEFGKWVTANKLDIPPANNAGVRSDAMWLAQHWDDVLQRCKTSTANHPTDLRSQYRKLIKQQEAAEKAKAKAAEKPPQVFKSITVQLQEAGLIDIATMSSISRGKVYAELREKAGLEAGQEVTSAEIDQRVKNAIAQMLVERQHQHATNEVDAAKASVTNLSDREKLDRAIERSIRALNAHYAALEKQLSTSYYEKMMEEANKTISQYEAITKKEKEKFNSDLAYLNEAKRGIIAHMTEEEFKLVLGCLHPDHPERTKERLEKAFGIFNRIKPYIDLLK